MAHVLFVCLHNAGRSQMSEALFHLAAAGSHASRSAGTQPAARVQPEVVEALQELGIDISSHVPRRLDPADAEWADVVVTMGCGDACPTIPGKRYLDWELADPAGRSPADVCAIRDEIAGRIDALLGELDTGG